VNSRERLFAALAGEPTDRVPVWLLFPYHPTGYYVDVRSHPQYLPVHELAVERAVTLNRRNLSAPLHTQDVVSRQEQINTPGGPVTRSWLECGDVSIYSQTGPVDAPADRVKLLASAEDLEAYAALPIETDPARLYAALDALLPRYLEERAEFPEHLGAMMLDLGEPIGALYGSSDLEEYAIWSITHDDVVVGLLERLMERFRLIYTWCLERDLADVYFLVGSELASPPLVSRDTFQRWIVPFARELIGLIHGHGKKVIQHYHGQIAEILPDFLTMGPDGLHTIEAPPIGDCTHAQAFDAIGDDITLIGNIQYDEFRALEPTQMQRLVRETLDKAAGRRLILSPTAGPYEEQPDPRVFDNYRAFLDAAWEYGSWPRT
jgi:uroporphyrinogen-III decarboxylase